MSDAHVQVVRGTPDDVELAALVAGLMAASAGAEEAGGGWTRSAWADRGRQLRRASSAPTPGPDAWRWSLRG